VKKNKNIKLKPKCFEDFPMAVTNTGHLIPCCYCDDGDTLEDPQFKKLLDASKISEHKNIQSILRTKEWIMFEANLRQHKGPPACVKTCSVKSNEGIVRKDTWVDPKTKKITKIRDM